MAHSIDFHFVNGRFSPDESQPIVTAIADSKRHHHARKMASHAVTEEDIKASETRIRAIESELRAVLAFIRAAGQRGSTIDIEGTISLREVEQTR